MSGLFGRAHVKWILAALLGLLLVLVACNTPAPTSAPATAELPAAATATSAPSLSPEDTALALGAQALAALKAQDMAALAALAHPTQGVRFSPYAFVRDEDLVFTPAQLNGAFSDSTVYEWGAYDGSGEPINLTFAGYYQEFIFDQDYTTAEAVSANERLGQGNSIDNSQEAYPGAMVVEYHFPGFNPDYEGMDWVSLRLVFQEFEGRWVLVGIIHDQWTI
ncbi:MAG: hypothetical protein BWY63_00948 [Chloroflexi bacterium ADurb.Bin360]|nr:MAG: hypothetical protein BWY63_00948 [Chloroflexi bacterium ADurb.Bin360]